MLKINAIVIGSLILTGCVNWAKLDTLGGAFGRPYIEPKGEKLARLRVSDTRIVRLVPNRKCLDWNVPESGVISSKWGGLMNDTSLNGRDLGMPKDEGISYFSEVYVTPNQPITLAINHGDLYKDVYFTPMPSSDYEFRTVCNSGGISQYNCHIEFNKLSLSGGKINKTNVDFVDLKGNLKCQAK